MAAAATRSTATRAATTPPIPGRTRQPDTRSTCPVPPFPTRARTPREAAITPAARSTTHTWSSRTLLCKKIQQ
ncbi:hypothetical protein BC828DRAFT_381029 [Blastocladiella britannica]|nr:hypothetical protein BC828DRAFT_381029 [Blastocladiella britannica]